MPTKEPQFHLDPDQFLYNTAEKALCVPKFSKNLFKIKVDEEKKALYNDIKRYQT